MANYANSLLAINAGVATKVGSADTITQAGGLIGTPIGASSPSTGAFTTASAADLSATASLLLQGAGFRQTGNRAPSVRDGRFLIGGAGTTSTTAGSGGQAVVMNRATGFTVSTVTAFTAGVAATSNPTFTNTNAGTSSLLAAGDVVLITGSGDPENDGLYIVLSVSGASFPQTVTVKGVGTTAVNANTPWANSQFSTATSQAATASKVDLYANVVADGTNFPDAGGTAQTKGLFLTKYAAGATESAFTANGSYAPPSSTLQSAYDAGASITTASSTAIEFVLTSGGFNVEGSEAVIFGGSTAISSFEVTTSTAVAITAGSTLDFTTSSGATTFTVQDNVSAAFDVKVGATSLLTVNTTNSQESVQLGANLLWGAGNYSAVITLTAGAAVTVNTLVAINGTAGKVFSADANGTGTLPNCIGVTVSGASADADPIFVTSFGQNPVVFDGNVTTADIGKYAYLSETAGQATLTAPTASGSSVVRVGIVAGADGTATATVLFSGLPALIAVN
jgi:hypothetical protein